MVSKAENSKIVPQIKIDSDIYWEFQGAMAKNKHKKPEALESALKLYIEEAKKGE